MDNGKIQLLSMYALKIMHWLVHQKGCVSLQASGAVLSHNVYMVSFKKYFFVNVFTDLWAVIKLIILGVVKRPIYQSTH